MLQIDIGDADQTDAQGDIVTLANQPGPITITNVAGATLNVFTNGVNGAVTTLTPPNSVTLSTPCDIQSQTRTTVLLTGGQYG